MYSESVARLSAFSLVYYAQQNYEPALSCTNKLLTLEPTNFIFHRLKIHIVEKLGKIEDAISQCNEAILIGLDKTFFYPLKISLLAKERKQEAVDLCNELIAIDPRSSEAYYLKTKLLVELKKKDDAMECCDMLLALNPEEPKSCILKSELLRDSGKKEEALEWCDKVISREVRFVDAYFKKIGLLRQLERYEEELKCVNQVIDLGLLERKLNAQFVSMRDELVVQIKERKRRAKWNKCNTYLKRVLLFFRLICLLPVLKAVVVDYHLHWTYVLFIVALLMDYRPGVPMIVQSAVLGAWCGLVRSSKWGSSEAR